MKLPALLPFAAVAALSFVSAGCGDKASTLVKVDGSSTVFPITEAVAEAFGKTQKGVRITVGISGTGGGIQKFCRGETDMTNASRPIKSSEVKACADGKIEYVEVPVAYDGIAIVVHPKNDWVKSITVAELKKLWEPEAQGKITKWSQVREGWPDRDIKLFGAGVDSGTYDYFTEAITGKAQSSRGDYTSSEDDNVLVQGIANDEGALGFFGFAYSAQNKDLLKLVGVDYGKADNGDGPILASVETVRNGTYQPLSRPMFVYLSKPALERKEVSSFIEFYLDNAEKLSAEVGYIPLPTKAYSLGKDRVAARKTGSLFEGGKTQVGISIEQLLELEGK